MSRMGFVAEMIGAFIDAWTMRFHIGKDKLANPHCDFASPLNHMLPMMFRTGLDGMNVVPTPCRRSGRVGVFAAPTRRIRPIVLRSPAVPEFLIPRIRSRSDGQ